MKRVQILAIVVVVGCALVVVGCRSATGRSFGQQWDDKTITAQVKTKLMTDRFLNTFSTGVGTQYGIVHLTGVAQTPEQRTEAERIARHTAGVKGVVNNILVIPPGRGTTRAAGSYDPAASPGADRNALSGQVTAIDHATGAVTMKTQGGDVMLRVPPATAQTLQQGQQLSIGPTGSLLH